jgi:hypothetical protein
MLKRSSQKIPARRKKRDPNKAAEAPRIPKASWLPHHTSDFAAWGVASDRARREFKEAWVIWTKRMGNDSLGRAADEARELWYYTLGHVYPNGFWDGMPGMQAGSTENLEMYLSFLEADPRFYRSGYAKSDVIRGVKRLALTPQQQMRLQDVVLRVVDKGFRREFRDYCRLARHVQSPGFLQELEERLSSFDSNLALRAKWVLDACVKV